VSYDEAFDMLGDIPLDELEDFEHELESERDQKIVFSTRHVSVLDSFTRYNTKIQTENTQTEFWVRV
jgi:hypothetical protein